MDIVSLTREPCDAETVWQRQYRDSITSIAALCDALELKPEQLSLSHAAARQFPLRVPRSYVRRMSKSDPRDPLLLQVLPHADEDTQTAGFGTDPLVELTKLKSPGLLQKYHGRALLLATGCCGIHCRYCFRRHFPYSMQNPRRDGWRQVLDEIAEDTSITEIILSGGDPLVLGDRELAELVLRLESIPHVRRLRIHTRLPAVIPSRINEELIAWVNDTALNVVIVLHINHAREISASLRDRLQMLCAANCTVLNQSVLLRGINDTPDALIRLSERLFQAGVLPYYLHLLDKVQGAAHFEVGEAEACRIMRKVAARLPGYLVPRLAKEEPGNAGKTLIAF